MNVIRYPIDFMTQPLQVALNNEQILAKGQEYKDLSLYGQAKLGVHEGVKCVARSIVGKCYVFLPVLAITSFTNVSRGEPASDSLETPAQYFLLAGIIAPILEEIAFRGIAQNSLSLWQRGVNWITPSYILKTRICKWLTSPSARICSITALFAFVHGSLDQNIMLVFNPIESVLHETTGNIVAPIFAHLTNNLIVFSFIVLLEMLVEFLNVYFENSVS